MPKRREDRLLYPGEVAELFRVSIKTVARWAATGRIHYVLTPGGHRRYPEREIRELRRRLTMVEGEARRRAQ